MQSKSQKAEISDASGAQGVSVNPPKRVWLRVAGGGVTLPSGKSYTTLVGDDRELPKHIEYVRADLVADLVKALELVIEHYGEDSDVFVIARHALAAAREVQP